MDFKMDNGRKMYKREGSKWFVLTGEIKKVNEREEA